jgi:membrane associated rhomboid family serine protease
VPAAAARFPPKRLEPDRRPAMQAGPAIDTPERRPLFWRASWKGRDLFPLRDENPTHLTPVLTVSLIAANVAVWLWVQGGGLSHAVLAESVCQWGAIPAEITGRTGGREGVELGPGLPVCRFGGTGWPAIATSMFLHGSWLHLIANMWFLWIFGNNVEDSMGHLRFVVFYLLCGAAATGAHIAMSPASPVPIVGASGAISGVMGAYLLFYPHVRIQTLFVFIVFFRILPVPAWLVLLLWFGLQLLSAYAAPVEGGGVAFWAHVGGFVAGLALAKPFENPVLVDAKRRKVRLSPFEIEHRGWW